MGLDPSQNWNRNIRAGVFSGGNDPTDPGIPAFMDHRLGPDEMVAALPGSNELRGKSIEVVHVKTGARLNGISIGDKGPHYDDTRGRPADRYWNTGARPRAETETRNRMGLDLSPAVWRAFGFGIRYRRVQGGYEPIPYSRRDPDPVFDWRFH